METFAELSEEAKQTAINNLREFTPDYDWYLPLYEGLIERIKELGLLLNNNDIEFEIYSRSPHLSVSFDKIWRFESVVMNHPRKFGAFKNYHGGGMLESIQSGTPFQEGFYNENNLILYEGETVEEIREYLDKCGDIFAECLQLLYKEYDYLVSDEAITECLEDNDYNFDINGNIL